VRRDNPVLARGMNGDYVFLCPLPSEVHRNVIAGRESRARAQPSKLTKGVESDASVAGSDVVGPAGLEPAT